MERAWVVMWPDGTNGVMLSSVSVSGLVWDAIGSVVASRIANRHNVLKRMKDGGGLVVMCVLMTMLGFILFVGEFVGEQGQLAVYLVSYLLFAFAIIGIVAGIVGLFGRVG